MNYIITVLMARDSNLSMERIMKSRGKPDEDRMKGLVDEVLVGIKCTGGSKDRDWS